MWFDYAVSKTLKEWKSYGYIGKYTFKEYTQSSEASSKKDEYMTIITFINEAEKSKAVMALFLSESEGVVKLELNVVKEHKLVLQAGDEFYLESDELDDLKKGDYDAMILSIVTFLLHGGTYCIVT